MRDMLPILMKAKSEKNFNRETFERLLSKLQQHFEIDWNDGEGGWIMIMKVGYQGFKIPIMFTHTTSLQLLEKADTWEETYVFAVDSFDEKEWYIDVEEYNRLFPELPWYVSSDSVNSECFSISDFWFATIQFQAKPWRARPPRLCSITLKKKDTNEVKLAAGTGVPAGPLKEWAHDVGGEWAGAGQAFLDGNNERFHKISESTNPVNALNNALDYISLGILGGLANGTVERVGRLTDPEQNKGSDGYFGNFLNVATLGLPDVMNAGKDSLPLSPDNVAAGIALGSVLAGGASAISAAESKMAYTVAAPASFVDDAAGFTAPKVYKNAKGQLTNGKYVLDSKGMASHTSGSFAEGKSQFLYNVDANKAVLDGAAFADANGLWKASSPGGFEYKAAIFVENGPVGVYNNSRQLTNYFNIYRTTTNMAHGAPTLFK